MVEASGSPGGLQLAVELARPLGTIVLKTTCAPADASGSGGGALVDALALVSNAIVVKELRVVGSRCGPHPMAMELLRDGVVDVTKFVEHEYPLSQAQEAMAHASQRGTLKVVLVMPRQDSTKL
eukprot:COSAG01_NODE_9589_length_2399_cov_15.534428_1_plen_124_part_00